jgi:alpha-amylase
MNTSNLKIKVKITFLALLTGLIQFQCNQPDQQSGDTSQSDQVQSIPFMWENANIYFLLTDRFANGNTDNDFSFERDAETGKLRGFMGGDMPGITQKIKAGYFSDLGVNAIWFTPVVEQVHGMVDEGTGPTYGYHGYWASDWTTFDPNFGTEKDLKDLVENAHAQGIRVILDVVINHTGPVTEEDPVWPSEWVRTEPQCTYQGYESTVTCTLVKNLPDIRTESNEEVELPEQLKNKWAAEGRLEKEMNELNEFFERTGYPRAPRFYIIKWLTDLIREYGVDGFRVDTVKHTEASIWAELYAEAVKAFADWKAANPDAVLDDNEFYMVGEVYGYNISDTLYYHYGDSSVNYFDNGFHSLINFQYKSDITKDYEELFSSYADILNGPLAGKGILNYFSSHDDGSPYDRLRENPFDAGTKLLLTPGASQIYYGDETARLLQVDGAEGDANLRSMMNWDELNNNASRNGYTISDVLSHWQKIGRFRRDHPAVGAGQHQMISSSPYVFSRTLEVSGFKDQVIAALDLQDGPIEIAVDQFFENGTVLYEYYSGEKVTVENGMVSVNNGFDIVLLGKEVNNITL